MTWLSPGHPGCLLLLKGSGYRCYSTTGAEVTILSTNFLHRLFPGQEFPDRGRSVRSLGGNHIAVKGPVTLTIEIWRTRSQIFKMHLITCEFLGIRYNRLAERERGTLAVVATLDTALVSTIGGALVKGTPRLTYVGLVSALTEVEGINVATLVCIVGKTQVGATGPTTCYLAQTWAPTVAPNSGKVGPAK